MLNDKRRATRRPMRYTAWIALENDKLQGCALADVSDTGCKLDVDDAAALPDQFMLLLSRRGFPKRRCKVVWRGEGQIGVAFDRTLHVNEIAKTPQRPADAVTVETVENAPPIAPAEPAETVDVDAPAEKA